MSAWISIDDTGRLGQGAPTAANLPADLVAGLHHTYPDRYTPAGRSTGGTGSPSRRRGHPDSRVAARVGGLGQ